MQSSQQCSPNHEQFFNLRRLMEGFKGWTVARWRRTEMVNITYIPATRKMYLTWIKRQYKTDYSKNSTELRLKKVKKLMNKNPKSQMIRCKIRKNQLFFINFFVLIQKLWPSRCQKSRIEGLKSWHLCGDHTLPLQRGMENENSHLQRLFRENWTWLS